MQVKPYPLERLPLGLVDGHGEPKAHRDLPSSKAEEYSGIAVLEVDIWKANVFANPLTG